MTFITALFRFAALPALAGLIVAVLLLLTHHLTLTENPQHSVHKANNNSIKPLDSIDSAISDTVKNSKKPLTTSEARAVETKQQQLAPIEKPLPKTKTPHNGSTAHNDTTPSTTPRSMRWSYAEAVKKAAPSVVNIYTSKVARQKRHPLFDDPNFERFFGLDNPPRRERMLSSLGSGVIVHKNGYIMTNQHVIAQADEIIVALNDGREAQATLIGTDPETDLAVLKIELPGLNTIHLASADRIEVGDVVLAIGNPFGVGQTITMGIVSATGRSGLQLSTYEDFIQTDAAINPGNSGGALVNPAGEMIGINTAIFSRSGGNQGIGFAIPNSIVANVFQQMMIHGRVVRGWLGIVPETMSDRHLNGHSNQQQTGVAVAKLFENGPAHQAGILPGDIITHINTNAIFHERDALHLIAAVPPGNVVTLDVVRNTKPMRFTAIVDERPPKQ